MVRDPLRCNNCRQLPLESYDKGIGIRTAQVRSERLVGQIHVYDGTGKGKSQAALGVVLRSIDWDNTRIATRVLLRFLKGPGRAYDEDGAIALQQAFLI